MVAPSDSAQRKPGQPFSTGPHYWSVLAAIVRVLGRGLHALLAIVVVLALTVGLPAALVHFIGWPLPDHVPTWDEIRSTLLAPMSPQFLLDVLACVLWPLWARFTFDVLAAIPNAARSARWHPSARRVGRGPLRAAAGLLVGAIVFSVLSSRTSAPAATTRAAATEFSAGGPTTVATAFHHPEAPSAPGTADGLAIVTAAVHTRAAPAAPHDMEIVRPPEHGVHDSLWRVAQRCLGDGNRWPEIWKLNRGATQADGTVFTTPSLIQPGWQLRLPALEPTAPAPPVVDNPAPQKGPGASEPPDTQAPSHPLESAPGTPAEAIPPATSVNPDTGISLPTGAFVGLGLAALMTGAMISARLYRRRRYRPGMAEPDDPGSAPVVRALRIAHDSVTLPHDDEVAPQTAQRSSGSSKPADLDTRDRAQATARAVLPTQGTNVVGLNEGRAVALDLARSRGLGLIGPGAYAAARALIVALLAQAANDGRDAVVVIPASDAEALFGADLPRGTPARLRVVDHLPTALSVLEAELLARARDDEADREFGQRTCDNAVHMVLVASPTADSNRRMQAILDNGAGFGLAGVLLGQWPPGGTARVREDGTVGATSPTLTDVLAGARLFTLPETDTTELLTLLRAADPGESERPDPATAATDDSNVEGHVQRAKYEFVNAESYGSGLETSTDGEPATRGSDDESMADRRMPHSPVSVADRRSAREEAPLHMQVLGRLRLMRVAPQPVDLIEALAPRQREILVYLASHPEGSRREMLAAALWPDAPGDRPYNSFHATLSQLRSRLRTATGNEISNITVNDDGHYALDHSVVTVDLWQLYDALALRRHAATKAERVAALRRVAELYRGDLADSISADWIDGPREALRRDVLDSLSALIRTIGADKPEQTLALIEQARDLDPYNEAIYRDLMRTQARLGQYDSIPRTLNLLTTSLATLDQCPTRDTVGLADFLRRARDSQLRDREAS